MTMYQAIVLANGIVHDMPVIKTVEKQLFLDNCIGDCFRVLKIGKGNFENVLERWNGYQYFTRKIINACYISAKVVFTSCSIEMD